MADRRKRSSSPSPDCSSLDNGHGGSLEGSDHFHTRVNTGFGVGGSFGGGGGGQSFHHDNFHQTLNLFGGGGGVGVGAKAVPGVGGSATIKDPPGHNEATTSSSTHSRTGSGSKGMDKVIDHENDDGLDAFMQAQTSSGGGGIPPFPGSSIGSGGGALRQQAQAATLATMQPPGISWNDLYIQLATFKQTHGHANPTNGNLANWLACQRLLYTQGVHPNRTQVKLLRDIGSYGFGSNATDPDGVGGPQHQHQHQQMQMQQQHNSSIPPFPSPYSSATTPTGLGGGGGTGSSGVAQLPPLSVPAPAPARKRAKTSKKKSSSVASLPPLNLPTSRGGVVVLGTSWDDRFQQLIAYKKSHGNNPNPPQTKGSPEADYKLAIWLNSQRQKFRKGTLDEPKLRQLRSLGCEGFKITTPSAAALNAPITFKKKKSMPPLPKKKPPPKKKTVAKKSPPPGRKGKSKGPPRKKVCWNDRYLELKAFKDRVGHANPNYGKAAKDSCKHLAQWLSNQRSDFRLGKKISQDQARMLRELGSRGFEPECQKVKRD